MKRSSLAYHLLLESRLPTNTGHPPNPCQTPHFPLRLLNGPVQAPTIDHHPYLTFLHFPEGQHKSPHGFPPSLAEKISLPQLYGGLSRHLLKHLPHLRKTSHLMQVLARQPRGELHLLGQSVHPHPHGHGALQQHDGNQECHYLPLRQAHPHNQDLRA